MNAWQEERERLARVAEANRRAAGDAVYAHGVAIGLEHGDAVTMARYVDAIASGVDPIDAMAAVGIDDTVVDGWVDMATAYAAGALTRLVDVDPATYRDGDPVLQRIDGEPFDPSWTRPRVATGPRGVTVRGARRGYVVGDRGTTIAERRAARIAGTPIVERLAYRDALVMADAMLRIDGSIDRLNLIGTDTYSWHAIVVHQPETIDTNVGRYYQRPEGAGHSIAGTSRPPRRFAMRRATASRFVLRVPIDVDPEITEPWHVVDAPVDTFVDGWWPIGPTRVVKRYATVVDGGTIVPGRGWVRRPRVSSWQPATDRHAKYARDLAWRNAVDGRPGTVVDAPIVMSTVVRRRVVAVDMATIDAVVDAATATATAWHGTATAATVRYRVDGVTVTVAHEPDRNRYRVTVTRRHDGSTVRESGTVRRVDAIATATRRMVARVTR